MHACTASVCLSVLSLATKNKLTHQRNAFNEKFRGTSGLAWPAGPAATYWLRWHSGGGKQRDPFFAYYSTSTCKW